MEATVTLEENSNDFFIVTFFFKNGKEIAINADEISLKESNGKLLSYSWTYTKPIDKRIAFFDLSEVIAVTTQRIRAEQIAEGDERGCEEI